MITYLSFDYSNGLDLNLLTDLVNRDFFVAFKVPWHDIKEPRIYKHLALELEGLISHLEEDFHLVVGCVFRD
jgi:hypothetical protein